MIPITPSWMEATVFSKCFTPFSGLEVVLSLVIDCVLPGNFIVKTLDVPGQPSWEVYNDTCLLFVSDVVVLSFSIQPQIIHDQELSLSYILIF